jgi:large subunit ribosomal protein L31
MAKKIVKSVYYPEAQVKCLNCSSVYTLGMTIESLNLEICGNCHPFYTGQEMLLDTAGRIEKFQNRMEKAIVGGGSKKTKVRKIKTSAVEITFNETEEDSQETSFEKIETKKTDNKTIKTETAAPEKTEVKNILPEIEMTDTAEVTSSSSSSSSSENVTEEKID